jgi:A/G-specific adenine glycosylase
MGISDSRAVQRAVVAWYEKNGRDLPWRAPDCTPWGVLVSEIMLQQTPVARVEPVWREWMRRWPTPADLAAADLAAVLRAWGTLGYPRRARGLHETARAIVERHDGRVPSNVKLLRQLPSVGTYTAAAVRAFGFGHHAVVLDTNVRRVLARVSSGFAQPPPHLHRSETAAAEALLPADAAGAVLVTTALMELRALVCIANQPRCERCPLTDQCAWVAQGRPTDDPHADRRRRQPWEGSDRQARGQVMAVMRTASGPVAVAAIAWDDRAQLDRCIASLVADRLLVHDAETQTLTYPT